MPWEDVHPSGDRHPTEASRDAVPQGQATRGRRRFLKAGLAAVPVIVTLNSRPAQAQPASLGTLGIFYGNYGQIEENGQTVWVPLDENDQPVRDPFGNIDYSRRSQPPRW